MYCSQVVELQLDYTDCLSNGVKIATGARMCKDVIADPEFRHGIDTCVCVIPFNITSSMEKNVRRTAYLYLLQRLSHLNP